MNTNEIPNFYDFFSLKLLKRGIKHMKHRGKISMNRFYFMLFPNLNVWMTTFPYKNDSTAFCYLLLLLYARVYSKPQLNTRYH